MLLFKCIGLMAVYINHADKFALMQDRHTHIPTNAYCVFKLCPFFILVNIRDDHPRVRLNHVAHEFICTDIQPELYKFIVHGRVKPAMADNLRDVIGDQHDRGRVVGDKSRQVVEHGIQHIIKAKR